MYVNEQDNIVILLGYYDESKNNVAFFLSLNFSYVNINVCLTFLKDTKRRRNLIYLFFLYSLLNYTLFLNNSITQSSLITLYIQFFFLLYAKQ